MHIKRPTIATTTRCSEPVQEHQAKEKKQRSKSFSQTKDTAKRRTSLLQVNRQPQPQLSAIPLDQDQEFLMAIKAEMLTMKQRIR